MGIFKRKLTNETLMKLQKQAQTQTKNLNDLLVLVEETYPDERIADVFAQATVMANALRGYYEVAHLSKDSCEGIILTAYNLFKDAYPDVNNYQPVCDMLDKYNKLAKYDIIDVSKRLWVCLSYMVKRK